MNASNDRIPPAMKAFQSHPVLSFWIYSTLYTLLYTLGIVLNAFVILMFFISKSFRIPQNLFLFSLSLADFIIALIIGLVMSFNFYFGKLIYGQVVCSAGPIITHSACFSSMNSNVQIALVRYVCIVLPHKKPDLCRWKILIPVWVAIWLVGPVVLIPGLISGALPVQYKNITKVCSFDYASSSFYLYLVTCITVVVMIVVAAAYVHIFVSFRRSKTRVSNRSSQKRMNREFRLVIPMLAIFIAFVLTWIPYIIVDIFLDPSEENFPWMHIFTGNLILLNTVLDPVIFVASSRIFKFEVRRIFCRISPGNNSVKFNSELPGAIPRAGTLQSERRQN